MWKVSSLAALLLLLAAHSATAGWIEQGDAGPLYQAGGFQQTQGIGNLDTITGTTTIPGPIGPGTLFRELVDVYSIRVTDPSIFYATTDPNIDPRASASGDSRLFLLDATTGDVILANDDTDNVNFKSLVAQPATFTALSGNNVHSSAQGVSLVAGQTYLLAVSEFAITAIDLTGVMGNLQTGPPLAADNAYEGPPGDPLNTNGGTSDGNLSLIGRIRPANANSDWGSNLQNQGMPEQGIDYVVALRGATFAAVPEPGTIAIAALMALAGGIIAMRRKLG